MVAFCISLPNSVISKIVTLLEIWANDEEVEARRMLLLLLLLLLVVCQSEKHNYATSNIIKPRSRYPLQQKYVRRRARTGNKNVVVFRMIQANQHHVDIEGHMFASLYSIPHCFRNFKLSDLQSRQNRLNATLPPSQGQSDSFLLSCSADLTAGNHHPWASCKVHKGLYNPPLRIPQTTEE